MRLVLEKGFEFMLDFSWNLKKLQYIDKNFR